MRRLFGLFALLIFALAGTRTVVAADAPPAPAYAWTFATLDPDVLAARLKHQHDSYLAMRDGSVTLWKTRHPSDDAAQQATAAKFIALFCYLLVSDDAYWENLWALSEKQANAMQASGVQDPFLDFALGESADSMPLKESEGEADALAAAGYPDRLIDYAYACSLRRVRDNPELAGAEGAQAAFTRLLDKWSAPFQRLVAAKVGLHTLYSAATELIDIEKSDDAPLSAAHTRVEQLLAAGGPDTGPLQAEFNGLYLVDKAWISRSAAFAGNVSQAQWAGFNDYLSQADDTLEAASIKYPNWSKIPVLMITVELGQGQGRDRMEQWFQRALQADPNEFAAYTSKFWYLQPRWYGSDQDLIDFGRECLALKDCPAPVLTAFFVGLSTAHALEKNLYRDPAVWSVAEQAYRQFLDANPQSSGARTDFALRAAQAGKFDVAREQLLLLGDNWQRDLMTAAQHAAYENGQADPSDAVAAAPAETETASPGPVSVLSTVVSVVRWIVGWL